MTGNIEEVIEHFEDKYLMKVPKVSFKENIPTSRLILYPNGDAEIEIKNNQMYKGVIAHEITHYRYWPYSIYLAIIAESYMKKVFGNKEDALYQIIGDMIINQEMARKGDYIKDLADFYNRGISKKVEPLDKVFLAFLSEKTGYDFGINKNNLNSLEKEKLEKLLEINWDLGKEKIKNALDILYKAGKILEDLVTEVPPEEEILMKINKDDIPKILKKIREDYPKYYDVVRENFEKKEDFKKSLMLDSYIKELEKYKIKIVGSTKMVKNGNKISGYKKWDGTEFDPIESLGFVPGEIKGDPIIVTTKIQKTSVHVRGKYVPDSVILLDTSGSMPSSFPAPQIISAMLIAKEYILNKREVSIATFGPETEVHPFSKYLIDVYSNIMKEHDGGTHLDIQKLKSLREKRGLDIYLITDSPEGGWDNLVETLDLLDYLNKNNGDYITIFWVNPEIPDIVKKYKNINSVLVKSMDDLVHLVINRRRRYWWTFHQ